MLINSVNFMFDACVADQGVLEDSSKKLLKQVEDLQDVSAHALNIQWRAGWLTIYKSIV